MVSPAGASVRSLTLASCQWHFAYLTSLRKANVLP
jgi:hypothetical protein